MLSFFPPFFWKKQNIPGGSLLLGSSLSVKVHCRTRGWCICSWQAHSGDPAPSGFHSSYQSSGELSHCLLFVQADSVNKAASLAFTALGRASDHSELAKGWANSMPGSHISSIVDLWTERNCSCFNPRGSSGSWEIQHRHVSIPGASEFGMLCSARYVYGLCLCSLREQAERHSVAVMNSTYVCVCVCVCVCRGEQKLTNTVHFPCSM